MDPSDTNRDGATRAAIGASGVAAWFCREVLPLESILMQYLRRNWANASDIADLRQDVYVRVYEAAQKQIPESAKSFVLTTAHNLLIDRVRRARVIPIETVTDLETLAVASSDVGADRVLTARDALNRLLIALEHLTPRSREAILLSKIEGLSRRQIAARMGIAEDTVKHHLVHGMHALAERLYGEMPEPRRKL